MPSSPLSNIFDYYHRCYRADSYDLAVWNLLKIRKDRRHWIDGKEHLMTGELPRLPIVGEDSDKLVAQTDTYRKERQLIYGCLMVTGELAMNSGFARQRQLCAPLLLVPAHWENDGDLYLRLQTDDLRVNRPLLRQLLNDGLDNDVLDSFPSLQWPLSAQDLSAVSVWLGKHTRLENLEQTAAWPKLADETDVRKAMKSRVLRVQSAAMVALVDRASGSRGVLHELEAMKQQQTASPSVEALFQAPEASPHTAHSEPELLPGLLSEVQQLALQNAASFPLSQISGPPGTGKSYTIAAVAVDRMLHGESVLVVSKGDQAVDVVADKLATDFSIDSGYVKAVDGDFRTSMKNYLDDLLNQGLGQLDPKALEKARDSLDDIRREKEKVEQEFEKHLKRTRRWGQWLYAPESVWQKLIARIMGQLVHQRLGDAALSGYPARLHELQLAQEKASASYINAYRRHKLAQLLASNRGDLVNLLKALKARTSKKQAEYFDDLDMRAVLTAFPIWLLNLDEINRVLPFITGMFDLVIVDEATQCDVASSLPALQRSQRALVVGDAKQLRHMSFLSRQQQQKILETSGLADSPLGLNYRDNSLLDQVSMALQSQQQVVMLDEHYRSQPELISFSNAAFYRGRLKIMQARPGIENHDALQLVPIQGTRNRQGVNHAEIDAVLSAIDQHITAHESWPTKPSVGVLSPFRDQIDALAKAIQARFSPEQIRALSLRVATPFGFQGEERELMLLSMSVDKDSQRAAAYLNRADMFNVAMTRAKARQKVFYSIKPEELPTDNLFRQYLQHQPVQANAGSLAQQVCCSFADAVMAQLKPLGVACWAGYLIAGQQVDIVCQYRDRVIGIDLVGFPGDFDDYYAIGSYKALSRAELHVLPISYFGWQKNPQIYIDKMLEKLGYSNKT